MYNEFIGKNVAIRVTRGRHADQWNNASISSWAPDGRTIVFLDGERDGKLTSISCSADAAVTITEI